MSAWTSIRTLIASFSIILVLAVAVTFLPVPVTEAPKQLHYVLFIEVCGELELIIITTEPLMMLTRQGIATQNFMDKLQSTPPERVIRLTHWDTFCPRTS